MNYRHSFHAGNFCDVFKHIILIALIQSMTSKEKPFCYLETHAGAGLYDLTSTPSQQTKEYLNGIEKVMSYLNDTAHSINLSNSNNFTNPTETISKIPSAIQVYVNMISEFKYPHYYLGSPSIAKTLLRSADQMILSEYHPEEYQCLKRILKHGKDFPKLNIAVHHRDGYEGLNAFLPPVAGRGLILIDPPYEKPSEWQDILQAIELALKKFPSGVYAIWYPIKNQKTVETFLKKLFDLQNKNRGEMMLTELSIYPSDVTSSLIGCGMVILNPPWQFENTLEPIISWLWQILAHNNSGYFKVERL